MRAEPDADQLEIAHVLFIDIIGYSKKLGNEQSALVKRLNEMVRHSEQCRNAEAAGKLIRIPTGDGMALAFFTTPDAPVRCAIELSQADQADPKLELRMGVHSGPVDRLADVNERANVTGSGINMAQRVMDCADAGHILLSQRIAEDLAQYGRWQPYLHQLGEVEVKHGVRLGIVNFYSDQFGNPALPEKIARRRREESARIEQEQKRLRRKRFLVAAILLVTLSIVAGAFIVYGISQRLRAVEAAAKEASAIPEKSVAVLMFENIGAGADNVSLASGLQDEIITKLAKIGSLKVIARGSTKGFENKPANLANVGHQLGVNAILEGSVQKVGEQLHVNVQLIKAATAASIWAETYDRQLIDIFSVEAEVATQVANALRAALSPEEKARVDDVPTENAEAYTLYRRARDIQVGISDKPEEYYEQRRLLEQAVAVEPTFALAHAALSEILTDIYNDLDRTADIKQMARAQAEEAIRLNSELGEAHKALGRYFYLGEHDYAAARREFDMATKALPNDAELIMVVALMGRRQGDWKQAIPNLQRAVSLNPRDLSTIDWLANTYGDLHQWQLCEEAKQRVLDVAISIGEPLATVLEAKLGVAEANFDRTGSFAKVKSVLSEVPPGYDPEGMITDFRWGYSMLERDYAAAQRVIDAYAGTYIQRAGGTRSPKAFYQGCIPLAQGEINRAKPLLQTALSFSQSELQKAPLSEQTHMDFALTCAFLGRKEDAIREGRRAAELLPEATDARMGTFVSDSLAIVYAWSGETDEAMALVQRLVTTPAGLNFQQLRHFWIWDPLRKDARFQKIVSGPEPKVIY